MATGGKQNQVERICRRQRNQHTRSKSRRLGVRCSHGIPIMIYSGRWANFRTLLSTKARASGEHRAGRVEILRWISEEVDSYLWRTCFSLPRHSMGEDAYKKMLAGASLVHINGAPVLITQMKTPLQLAVLYPDGCKAELQHRMGTMETSLRNYASIIETGNASNAGRSAAVHYGTGAISGFFGRHNFKVGPSCQRSGDEQVEKLCLEALTQIISRGNIPMFQ